MEPSYYRTGIAVVLLILIVITMIQTIVSWKKISWGQKTYLTSSILYMWYILDGLRQTIEQNTAFRTRLFVLAVALVLHIIYLLEPKGLTKKRRGRGMMQGPDGPPED